MIESHGKCPPLRSGHEIRKDSKQEQDRTACGLSGLAFSRDGVVAEKWIYGQTVAAGSGLSRNKSLNQQQGWILRENRPTLCSKKDVVSRSGPSREKVLRKRPQSFPEHKLKIIFPLNMPRAKRRAFQTISPYTARRASAVSARKSAPRGRPPALPPRPGPRWPPSAGRTARRKHRCSRQR